MNYHLIETINYFDEALAIIEMIANVKTDVYFELAANPLIKNDRFKSTVLKAIIDTAEKVREGCQNEFAAYGRYFREVRKDDLTVIQIIMDCEMYNLRSEKAIIAGAEALSCQEWLMRSYQRIAETSETPDGLTMSALVASLDQNQIDPEISWMIIENVYHHHELSVKLLAFIDQVIGIIRKDRKKFNQGFSTALNYLKEMTATVDLLKVFREEFDLSFAAAADVYIRPGIFYPHNIRMDMKKQRIVMSYGCLITLDEIAHKQGMSDQDVIAFGKIIQDESKLRILKELKQRDMYGKELADILKLTTPTISYHMNTLFNAGLVLVDVQANRIYYRLNRARIETDLDEIKKILAY